MASPPGEPEPAITERDHLLLSEAVVAEQCGDLRHALRCLQEVSGPAVDPWEGDLIAMIELGDQAEPWHWARFTMGAARRWILGLPIPLVARVQREIAAAAGGVTGACWHESLGWVAGTSAIPTAAASYMLFDELMIEVFLIQCAPILAKRSGDGRTWAETPGRVCELVGVDGIELRLRDRSDGSEYVARHLSELVGRSEGDLVYGHLIDVPGDPGLVFAMRPIVVDELVAQRLVRGPDEDGTFPESVESRCAALGAAVRSGERYCQSFATLADHQCVVGAGEDCEVRRGNVPLS
ncbi:hypothetical protein EF847_03425 [Actinobacteria bacterium YIM 96077]|uniref:Uncharacterized protein n=1 Tax=Phytoactinopolyspora halophila TaxID=1981511 RepID=A0A329R2J3_9ACTN|nr:hypothetical protein EF847_03425 [Actinobacteria bacterium YIM 96077]RAW18865.1 hypothetical protein DPM12_02085 [Phytoactinopolyspora halophila]